LPNGREPLTVQVKDRLNGGADLPKGVRDAFLLLANAIAEQSEEIAVTKQLTWGVLGMLVVLIGTIVAVAV
jgi:hypothetical protein